MSIFAMLDIWGWIKPYLELCDLPENWYGGAGYRCGGLTTAKTFFASRICCKDLSYQFSVKSDNFKYGLTQPQLSSVANILILSPPPYQQKLYQKWISTVRRGSDVLSLEIEKSL